jgi:hypothetical protein
MTSEQALASLMRLNQSGVSAEVWRDWYAAIAQPQPQQGGLPAKVSDDEWAKMPAAERLDYARKFPQPLDHGKRKT